MALTIRANSYYDVVGDHQSFEESKTVELFTVDTITDEMYEACTLYDRADRRIVFDLSLPESLFSGTNGKLYLVMDVEFLVDLPFYDLEEGCTTSKTGTCAVLLYYRRDRERIIIFDNHRDYHYYPYEPPKDDELPIF
jgi:hypothetical protein